MKQTSQKNICHICIGSVVTLMVANILLRIFYFHESLFQLLENFLYPLILVSSVYILIWEKTILTKLLREQLPKSKFLVVVLPILFAVIAVLSATNAGLDFTIVPLSLVSLSTTVYILRGNAKHICVAIALQTLWFFLVAALVENPGAMVTILVTSVVLLLTLHKVPWFQPVDKTSAVVAVINLLAAVAVTFFIPKSGVLHAFLTPHRETAIAAIDFAAILSKIGGLVFIPVIALVVMVASVFCLTYREKSFKYYFCVTFSCLLICQTIGGLLVYLGWNWVAFSPIIPFLTSGCYANALFLGLILCILPPKAKEVSIDVLV